MLCRDESFPDFPGNPDFFHFLLIFFIFYLLLGVKCVTFLVIIIIFRIFFLLPTFISAYHTLTLVPSFPSALPREISQHTPPESMVQATYSSQCYFISRQHVHGISLTWHLHVCQQFCYGLNTLLIMAARVFDWPHISVLHVSWTLWNAAKSSMQHAWVGLQWSGRWHSQFSHAPTYLPPGGTDIMETSYMPWQLWTWTYICDKMLIFPKYVLKFHSWDH